MSQVTVTVVYRLSEAGQRAAALQGLRPSRVQVLHLPATPALVERATPTAAGGLLLGIGGRVRIRVGADDVTSRNDGRMSSVHDVDVHADHVAHPERQLPTWGVVQPPELDAPLTDEAGVLAALARDAEHVAARVQEAQAAEDERLARVAEGEAKARAERLADHERRLAEVLAERRALVQEADAFGVGADVPASLRALLALDFISPGSDAATELLGLYVGKLERDVERAKAHAAMRVWVDAHGSERLREAVALGVEAEALYADERLALERPGWCWEPRDLPEHEARNPPLEALALLRQARAVDPGARLVWTGSGFAAGGVEFLGRTVWLDQHVARTGATEPLARRGLQTWGRGGDDE